MSTAQREPVSDIVQGQYVQGVVLLPSVGLPYSRSSLVDSNGIRYLDFLRRLKPNYRRAWLDIFAGYLAIGLLVAAVALIEINSAAPLALIVVPLAALALGVTLNYLGSFMHEAVHGNLAASKELNDRLVNALVCPLFGAEIKAHRLIHFDHHRYLGQDRDPERTYQSALTFEFLFEGITGIKLVKTLIGRTNEDTKRRQQADQSAFGNEVNVPGNPKRQALLGAAINGTIVIATLATGLWWVSLTWIAGMLFVFPLVASVRQLLEHRPLTIDRENGATTRMFGNDFLSAIFGSAGFSRHLLHHWEPQVSYTRLADLESFLLRTDAATLINERRGGYATTFFALLEKK